MREIRDIPCAGCQGNHKMLKFSRVFSSGMSWHWKWRGFIEAVQCARIRSQIVVFPLDHFSPWKFQNMGYQEQGSDHGSPQEWVREWRNSDCSRLCNKMVQLIPAWHALIAAKIARLYWDEEEWLCAIPRSIMSDTDPRFISDVWLEFWKYWAVDERGPVNTTYRQMDE